MSRYVIGFILALSCLALPNLLSESNAKSREVVFFYSHQPPFEYTDINGQATGLAIEDARGLFAGIGWNTRFVYNSVSRGLVSMHSGEYDFSTAVSPNYAIKEKFWVSRAPLYYIRLSVIRKKTTPPLENLSALQKSEFAALSQNSFNYLSDYLEGTDSLKGRYSVDSLYQGLRLVELDRLPYFLTYTESNSLIQRETLDTDEMLRVPVHLIISKTHPNAKELLQQVDTFQLSKR